MNIQILLSEKIKQALLAVGVSEDCEPQVRQSTRENFGDYQINGVMEAAKRLKISPKKLANKILTYLDLTGIARKIDVVDPAFINIFLDPVFLVKNLNRALQSNRLGITQLKPKTIVVDYSSPNIAKEMHVGHLRSTIIGDAVVRVLEFFGHKVIRANHIGDWGTQFGMLIALLKKKQKENMSTISLDNLEDFYQKAKKYFDEDKTFAEKARNYVVRLQNGDQQFIRLWRKLVDITISKNQVIYDRLNVSLTQNDIMGESLYNSMLPDIVADLKNQGLAVEDKGAVVVFLNEFKNKEGEPIGVIIQKKDGGYLYTTTDIACVKYRYETLHADRILYYVDSRQHQHLMQVWTIARKAGYIPDSVTLEHHMFGMVLGKNGKPFKTRVGGTIKLSDLLDEAEKRARRFITKKNINTPVNILNKLANVIGIGAVKYADLSKNRVTNYVFNWNNMLTLEGNTALYIQYAYTRILSLLRKAEIDKIILSKLELTVISNDLLQMKLATFLLKFEEALWVVARDGTPHIICSYLYKLAVLFSNFYENYPILSAKNKAIRNGRLQLLILTAKTLKLGLDFLGIETVEWM